MRIEIVPLLLTVLAVSPVGCASSPEPADLPMKTLIVDEAGIHPAVDIPLRQFGSVVWLNGFRGGQKIRVTVERPVGASEPCVTRLGFEDGNGRATSPELTANHGSVLCFHETGEFAYSVDVGKQEHLNGKIRVTMGEQ